jgi:gamma-glutamyltranspeptidase
VVNPAIELAENGVPISQHLAGDIKEAADKKTNEYGEFPKLRSFLTKNDSWPTYFKEGELLKNPRLAKTLRSIAQLGSDGLYTGEMAQQIVNDVEAAGGILSVDDMANYLPTLRSPLIGSASGFTFAGVPPPSSGGATLIGAARFLSGYSSPLSSAPDTLSVHRMVESLRHAFALRMSLCDPDFNKNTTNAAVQDLMEGDYMEKLRQMTKDNDTLPLTLYGGKKWAQLNDLDGMSEAIKDAHEGDRRLRGRLRHLARPFGYLEDSGTSHLSVVDSDGNAVSITSSVNQVFGSYVFSSSTGILLGNTMDDFGNPGRSNYYGLKPSKENFIAAGKKPLSSMSPTMVFRKIENAGDGDLGKLALVIGGSGGPKIITSVLQVFINYCLLGMSLFDAVARPRVHEQLLYHDAAVTTTEKDNLDQGPLIEVSQRTKEALLNRGHAELLDIDYAGTVQAIGIDLETSRLSAVSDIRKGGTPNGY